MDTDFGSFKVDYTVPSRISYDIQTLKKFIEKDPDAGVIFYGGEPLLCIDKIEEIMDLIKAKYFLPAIP